MVAPLVVAHGIALQQELTYIRNVLLCVNMHCFESVTLLYESTADPDIALFFSDFQDANKK